MPILVGVNNIRSEIFCGHVTEPELVARLKVSIESMHPFMRHFLPETERRESFQTSVRCNHSASLPGLINSRFASSRQNHSAIYSTHTRRTLSACGAPAAVWTTAIQHHSSPFHFFTDSDNGNMILRKCSTSLHFVKC